MKTCLLALLFILPPSLVGGAGGEINVFPTVKYDQYIIYQSLALFWLFILGILVIIRMKLKEIKRIQELALDVQKDDIPYLN